MSKRAKSRAVAEASASSKQPKPRRLRNNAAVRRCILAHLRNCERPIRERCEELAGRRLPSFKPECAQYGDSVDGILDAVQDVDRSVSEAEVFDALAHLAKERLLHLDDSLSGMEKALNAVLRTGVHPHGKETIANGRLFRNVEAPKPSTPRPSPPTAEPSKEVLTPASIEVDGGNAKDSKPATKEHPNQQGSVGDLESRLLGVLAAHPDWTVQRIADAVGVVRQTPYKSEIFKKARATMREAGKSKFATNRSDRRRGRTGRSVGDTLGDTHGDTDE